LVTLVLEWIYLKLKDKYFPYPVIRSYHEDFQDSVFNIEIQTMEDETTDELVVHAHAFTNNAEISRHIKLKNIYYVLHAEESKSMFRKTYYFSSNTHEIRIPLSKVKSEIEIVPLLITTSSIQDFYPDDLDKMYADINISYEEKNIIGIGTPKSIELTKEDDDLEGVKSIFLVVPDEEVKDNFILELPENFVMIKVSQESFELYNKLSKLYRLTNSKQNKILLTLMVLPAFVEVLNTLKDEHETYEDYIWFRSIIASYEKKGIDLIKSFEKSEFSSYTYAQIIFEDIIKESLQVLDSIREED